MFTFELDIENDIKLMDVKAINIENRIRKVTRDPKRTKYGKGKEVPEWLLE